MGSKLIKEIKLIPGDNGFWRESTEETFKDVAERLILKGFSQDEAIEILSSLYVAVSEEFGD